VNRSPQEFDRVIREAAEAEKPPQSIGPDEGRDYALDLEVHARKCFEDELKQLQDNHDLRLKYVGRIFYLVAVWLGCVVLCVGVSGFNLWGFRLSDTVLIAFISSTTVNVVGLFVLVAKWMFPDGRRAADHRELLDRLQANRSK
jgi:hypothetical protein